MAMTQQLKKNSRVLLAVALLLPAVVHAVDVQVAGEAGVGVSDNIQRAAANERSETIATVGVQFSVVEASRRVAADVTGDFAYMDYTRGTYASELIGNASGSLRLNVVDERLDWVVQDNFGQTRRDLFAAQTPANRENINYFSTGPNFSLNLFSEAKLRFSARYARVDYEISPFDSVRYSGQLGLERELSSATRVSMNVNTERVKVDALAGVADYDRQEAFARYALQGARSSFSLDAGMSRIDLATGADSGALVRLSLSRKVGGLSTLSFEAGREFTDAGNSLRTATGDVALAPLGSNTLSQTANPFTSQYARVGWEVSGRRTAFKVGAGYNDENYLAVTGADRQRLAAYASVARQLGARFNANLSYAYAKDDVVRANSDFSEKTASVGVAWQAGRRLAILLSAENYQRSSQIAGGDSTENRAWLRLRYGDASVRQAGEPTGR